MAACGGGGGDDPGGGGNDASMGEPDAGMNGEPDADTTPDAATTDAAPADAGPSMSIYDVVPQASSRHVTTELTVLGYLLEDGAALVLTNCDTSTEYDLSASVTVAEDGRSLSAVLEADATLEQGLYTVTVTNPDMASDALECAFRISADMPPAVTSVIPATAYHGVSGDGISSDTSVTIEGAGFISTPNVRWVKTDGTRSYDALEVGFISGTKLSVVVPSETLSMEAGEYHVYVVNPNLLSGQWMEEDDMGAPLPGIFTVTSTPPPRIDDVTPSRVANADCTTTTMTVTGAGFDPGATAWWVAPEGTTCTGSMIDENGYLLCPVSVDAVVDASTLEARFDACPPNGAWPIVVRNPDGQSDMYFTIEIRPNNSGHLDASDFEVVESTLNEPRFKHGTEYGFGAFGNAFLYAAGGQDAAGLILDSVEISQLDVFGQLGPFRVSQQYGGLDSPRIVNRLTTPRAGTVLLRVGKQLFAIGGADAATDVVDTVPALATVERASILSYYEMPAIKLPEDRAGGALPQGSWYYRVSAIGPWGESLGSREVIAFRSGGQIQVCWDMPAAPGATSYNVYRSLASDGRAQSSALIAAEVPGPCFIDSGLETLAPAPGNLRGGPAAGGALAAGSHEYRVSAHLTLADGSDWQTYAGYAAAIELTQADLDAGNAAIQLSWDAVPDAVGYSLYKLDAASGEFRLVDTGGMLVETTYADMGAAFDASEATPRQEIRPLATGSLSLWDGTSVPDLNVPREGLDGVVIDMDPAMAGGQVARILVAGGRTQNQEPADPAAPWYLTTAESLGIYEDGSLEATWYPEAPEFNFARVFYSLVTTQHRNTTPYPPEPDEPPCGDFDNDGYVSCDCGGDDCNDADPTVNPGADEVCGDGIDQNCDMGCEGGTDVECACEIDADGDGYLSEMCGADDCCDDGSEGSLGCSMDTAEGINPGAEEICENGIDEDCDGIDDECTIVIDAVNWDAMSSQSSATSTYYGGDPTTSSASSGTPTSFSVKGDEPVYVIAALGDDTYIASSNSGRSDFEACQVDDMTGHLACDTTWVLQDGLSQTPQPSFGMDALLYFDYLYPFYGLATESIGAVVSRQLRESSIHRFPVEDPNTAAGQILGDREAANVSPTITRAYYNAVRLMAYIYLVGGWTDTGTEGVPGPTDTVERHIQ